MQSLARFVDKHVKQAIDKMKSKCEEDAATMAAAAADEQVRQATFALQQELDDVSTIVDLDRKRIVVATLVLQVQASNTREK